MQLNTTPTELTTAVTDGLLGLLVLACIVFLRSSRTDQNRSRQLLWFLIFLLAAIGAGLGTVIHGLELSREVRFWLWQPLYLSIGLLVSLFVVVAAVDVLGSQKLRLVLWIMLPATLVFQSCTLLGRDSFWIFVAYETACMGTALAGYVYLAARGTQGATPLAIGILLSITAAGIQASKGVAITVGLWPLDHNGVFHLVQMPAIIFIAVGVRLSSQQQARRLKRRTD